MESKMKESKIDFGRSVQLTEFVRKCDAKYLLDNINEYPCRESTDENYNPKNVCISYLKDVLKSKNGCVKRVYYNNDGCGRMYLKKGQSGFQTLMREYRAFLAFRNYYDVDVKNAHPCILLSVCRQKNIEHTFLKEYVERREELYKSILESDKKITKNALKTVFVAIINGAETGGYEKIKMSKDDKKFIKNFVDEMKHIRSTILDEEDNKKFVAQAALNKDFNIDGSAIALYLHNQENIIIQFAKKFLTKKGYEIGSLIFDGLMVRNSVPLTQSVLKELNAYVLRSTNIKVEFIIKEWEVPHIPNDSELIYKEECVVEHDEEASILILNEIKGEVIKCGRSYYLRKFPNTNIYTEDNTPSHKETNMRLFSIISKMSIKLLTTSGIKEYSKTTSGCKKLVDMVLPNVQDDPFFAKKLFDSNIGKLCFMNGYYDISTKTFKNYDDKVYTIKYVERDYNPEYDKKYMDILMSKIIDPILGEEKGRMLRYLSRSLFGTMDKKWAVGLGARNTGKSQLTILLELTFNGYIKIFNAENLMCMKVGGGDIAKKLSWLVPFQYSRLYLSNEMKTDDDNHKKLTLDCNSIKSISSGGDTKEARQNYENEKNFRLQGNLILFMNELAKLSSEDATETLHQFNFNTIFTDEIGEKEQKINNAGMGCKYMQKDDNVKLLLENSEIQNCFIHLILDNYGEAQKPSESNNFDVPENENTEKIHDYFEFTLDRKDRLSNREISLVLKETEFSNISSSKLKLIFNKNGSNAIKSNGVRGYEGIKIQERKQTN